MTDDMTVINHNDGTATIEHPTGHTVEITWCPEADDPREWDNAGTMVCAHRKYDLGDRQSAADSFQGLLGEIVEHEGGADIVWLPLYLFDHSGLTMRTDDTMFRQMDGAGWDWGVCGVIYVTYETIAREWGDTSEPSIELARECMVTEVETYNQYLTGDTWFVCGNDPDGELREMTGMVFGSDEALSEGRQMMDYLVGGA
jgi:hypothetical protein